MQRLAILSAVLLALAACENTNSGTKGIGTGTDDYKRSPCACDFKPFPPLPAGALPA